MLFVIVAPLLIILPLVTGYVASGRGRSFWGWFGLACVLPLVSFGLLLLLPEKAGH